MYFTIRNTSTTNCYWLTKTFSTWRKGAIVNVHAIHSMSNYVFPLCTLCVELDQLKLLGGISASKCESNSHGHR